MLNPADFCFNTLNGRKPTLLISACLLGEPVRYDGKSRPQPQLVESFRHYCEITAICPEVGAGLPVPRPPVQLVDSQQQLHALGVEEKGLDVTDTLVNFAHKLAQLPPAHGMIVKSRSPSCGFGSTPIFNRSREQIRVGNGLFSQTIRQQWPDTLICEDEALLTDKQRRHFLLACYQQLDKQLTHADDMLAFIEHWQTVGSALIASA